jgi:hypothetical protein
VTAPPCEVCGALPAYDALTAWLCTTCIELEAGFSPDVLEYQAKKMPRGSRERVALRIIANWQRRVFTQPRARQ